MIRLPSILLVNILVFVLLLGLGEISYRIYREGPIQAFVNLGNYFLEVPYSNLGTGNWVITDEVLGYRLNPRREGINNLSIRHKEVLIPKPIDLYRIMYLGDSLPWDRPGFVSFTRETLKREGVLEVINASVPGYTTYQELLFFKTYLKQTEPDLVILTYCLNDNHKFLHRFDDNAKMLMTSEARDSLRIHSIVDEVVSRSYLLTRIKLRLLGSSWESKKHSFQWENRTDFHIAWKDEPWKRFEEYILELKEMLSGQGANLAIVVFPYEPQLDSDNLEKDPEYVLKPQTRIRQLCQQHHVPCLDLFPKFLKKNEEGVRLFRDGVHLNKKGHELTAGWIDAFLHDNQLLPQT